MQTPRAVVVAAGRQHCLAAPVLSRSATMPLWRPANPSRSAARPVPGAAGFVSRVSVENDASRTRIRLAAGRWRPRTLVDLHQVTVQMPPATVTRRGALANRTCRCSVRPGQGLSHRPLVLSLHRSKLRTRRPAASERGGRPGPQGQAASARDFVRRSTGMCIHRVAAACVLPRPQRSEAASEASPASEKRRRSS